MRSCSSSSPSSSSRTTRSPTLTDVSHYRLQRCCSLLLADQRSRVEKIDIISRLQNRSCRMSSGSRRWSRRGPSSSGTHGWPRGQHSPRGSSKRKACPPGCGRSAGFFCSLLAASESARAYLREEAGADDPRGGVLRLQVHDVVARAHGVEHRCGLRPSARGLFQLAPRLLREGVVRVLVLPSILRIPEALRPPRRQLPCALKPAYLFHVCQRPLAREGASLPRNDVELPLPAKHQQNNNSSMRVINRVDYMIWLLKAGARTMARAGRETRVSAGVECGYEGRAQMVQRNVARLTISYRFSAGQEKQGDSRKLLEISQSIIQSLLQKSDLASTVEIIHQMAITLVQELFKSNRPEGKKTLLYIFQLIGQLEPHLGKSETQSLTKTLKLLTEKIDSMNDTQLIILTDQTYLKFLEKEGGKASIAYISALSKLAENYISGDRIERAYECLSEIQALSEQSAPLPLDDRIKNLISLGIVNLSRGESEASIQAYKQALKLASEGHAALHLKVYRIGILECLGDIYKDRLELLSSLQSYEQALTACTQFFSDTNIHSLILLYKVSKALFGLQRYQEFVAECKKIEEGLEGDAGLQEEFQAYNEIVVLMGEAYTKLGQPALAIHYFQKYIQNAEKSIILEERQYSRIIHRLVNLLLQEGKPQEALQHLKSLSRYYKIEGNDAGRESCEQRAKAIQESLSR